MLMPKITVNGNDAVIGEIKIPYSFIKDHMSDRLKDFRDDKENTQLQSLFYEAGNSNNCVVYKDGSKEELPTDCEKLHLVWTDRYIFKFEYKEFVVAEKQKNKVVQTFTVFMADILQAPYQNREALQRTYCNERGGLPIPTTQDYKRQATIIAKSRLTASDWTQLIDVRDNMTEEEKEFWIDYRETLRDAIKSNDPFHNVIIPVPPAGSTQHT